MSRKSFKPGRGPSKKRNERSSSSPCRALIIVDSSRVRRRALSDCQRARTTFHKAEAELQAFEAQDKPAYVRWYRAEFGPRIEEMKSHIDACHALDERMARISRFARMSRCGLREATALFEQSPEEFARMEAALKERVAREEEAERQRAEAEFERMKTIAVKDILQFLQLERRKIRRCLSQGQRPRAILFEIVSALSFETGIPEPFFDELFRRPECAQALKDAGLADALNDDGDEEVNDPFGFSGGDDDEDDDDNPFGPFDGHPFGAAPPPPERPADHRARIKALFRELAFALHPDQSDSGSDPKKLALWHQVQAAMEAGDLDRLEVLHAHVQVMRGELSDSAPVSRLMALTAMYRESRNALRRKIREFRKQLEWGFAAAGESRRAEVRRVVAAQLEVEVELARLRWEDLQAVYRREFAPRRADGASKRAESVREAPLFPGW
ncbi:MAG TPA: hypothetical protein PKE26_00855 [Kiritimatiellia bacterium]|nr:hypothetical protein [Kiritimatiellia bacterium]HMO97642.1 hypothetical protein [Kiritimatiellia bacterium]HMP97430.1 hypothetical protein [Kiritimatiellia bacterium]